MMLQRDCSLLLSWRYTCRRRPLNFLAIASVPAIVRWGYARWGDAYGVQAEIVARRDRETRPIASRLPCGPLPSDQCLWEWNEDPKPLIRPSRRYAQAFDGPRSRPGQLRNTSNQSAPSSFWRGDCIDHPSGPGAVTPYPGRWSAEQLFT